MTSLPVVQRHPALRWLAPALLLGVVAAVVSTALDEVTPAALVTAVQHSSHAGFSGTVVSQLSLGLPALPTVPGWSGAGAATSFSSLLAGSHTLQVWNGGARRQRVALLGPSGETDLFRNGNELWRWNSASGVAQHIVLPDGSAGQYPQHLPAALTPGALAIGALRALDARTALVLAPEVTVADRAAYQLVLTPRSAATKIGAVRVAVDGLTKVPLGVQVYAKGSDSPAIDVAYTSIRFDVPAERNFSFVPPPNATIDEVHGSGALQSPVSALPTASGRGWAAVLRLPDGARGVDAATNVGAFRDLDAVSGHWGRGRLVQSDLLSLLVTHDGRVFAGAVQPGRLYAAAARQAAG
jgi:outer membrane lipoprotein-sorting protein